MEVFWMKKNKNVRRDDLSSVSHETKRVYKMYKSKKNWVVAPVILATLLGTIGTAPITMVGGYIANAEETTVKLTVAEDALAKINASTVLDATQKATAIKAVKTATTDAAVYSVLKTNLYEQEVTNQKVAFVADVKVVLEKDTEKAFSKKLDGLTTAITDAVTTFNDGLEVNPTANFYNVSYKQAAFATALKTAQAELANTKALVEKTDLTGFATEIKTQINALGFLTPDQKTAFGATIDANVAKNDADSRKNILVVLTDATKKNTTAKETAVNLLKEQLAKVTDVAAKAELSRELDAVASFADADTVTTKIAAQVAKEAAATQFENAKTTLYNEVSNLDSANLGGQDNKTALLNDINDAKTQAQLDAAKAKRATMENEAKDLAAVINDVNKTPLDEAQLTNVQVTNFKVAKDNALNLPDTDAKKATLTNWLTQVQVTKDKNMAAARAEALKTLASYTGLTADHLKAAQTDLTNAATLEAIKTAVTSAQTQETADKVAAAKETAQNTINGLTLLKGTDKQNAQNAIANAVKTEDVDNAVEAAIKTLAANGDKASVTQALNAMSNLSDAEKKVFIGQLSNDAENNKKVVDNATTTAGANKDKNDAIAAFETAKKNAIATLKTDNKYADLTTAQREDYISKISLVEKTTDIAAVLAKAETDSAKNKTEKTYVEGEKATLLGKVTGNTKFLTNDQVLSFTQQIITAETRATLSKIATELDKAILDQQAEKLSAADYYVKVNGSFTHFTSMDPVAKAKALNDLAANQTDKAKMTDIYTAAKLLDDTASDKKVTPQIDALIKSGDLAVAQSKIKDLKLKANIDSYTAKLNGLIAVRDAKIAANAKVVAADYLTADEKAAATKAINNATTIAEVDKVLAGVAAKEPAEKVQLYRAYNPNSGEHLYTIDKAEFDRAVTAGWKDEGFAWTAASKGTPVYRLYNPNSGEHFYTVDETEYNNVAAAGWTKEGVVFYSANNKAVNVYRLFNPNAKGAGSHHFTTDAAEVAKLVKAGWKSENIAFFGL